MLNFSFKQTYAFSDKMQIFIILLFFSIFFFSCQEFYGIDPGKLILGKYGSILQLSHVEKLFYQNQRSIIQIQSIYIWNYQVRDTASKNAMRNVVRRFEK